jgi:4-aminobutyrate aminotransferase-like enzyme/Ser/Thr protein kinase RdoA (MazF antagonist)
MHATAPRLDSDTAARIARDHFGIAGTATPLPSERDQNFLVETSTGNRTVIKIANANESRAMLEAQQAAIRHVGNRHALVPTVIAAKTGGTLVEVPCDGQRHLAWAIRWIDGVTLATTRWRSSGLLEDFGGRIGTLRRALADFDHPAIHRDFYWDLANARQIVARQRGLVTDPAVAEAIDAAMRQFDELIAPHLRALSRAAVHGDLNDHNVLVRQDDDVELSNQRIAGFVDFGDMVHSYAVADLAIAAAYMMLDADDPLAALMTMARGYHAEYPLEEAEIAALFGLSVVRLCASACIAAQQQRDDPANAYLGVSQQAIRRALPRLAATPFRVAEMLVRDACGLLPLHRAHAERWIAYHAATASPVLGIDLRRERWMPADLGVTSTLLSADAAQNSEPLFSRRLFEAIREAGASVAVGGYNEPRLLYLGPDFAGTRETDERRTVHLGVDLWAKAGTPVFAPVHGVVHSIHDNAAPYDYGPVIILRHALGEESNLFTLYGHLSRESLAMVAVGQIVAAGQQIATLGAPEVNGGWSPHLHFQVITDLLGLGHDFPGVARASQRHAWLGICPDPNPLLGILPPVAPRHDARTTLSERRTLLPRNISVSYREPVKVVRGWKQYLLDDTGRKFLDAYNNVPHVGHCHPRVVEAGVRQMALLNTNTRYLSDSLNEYATRLTDTLPEPLRVCVFVNSASEANELALRMARAHTRARDMIVLESAYHGNTTTLIDLSPYKHAGPGGTGAPHWVHVAPLPDDYRGLFKRRDPDAGTKYAAQVTDIVQRVTADGRRLAGFIAETCPSVGGQIILPRGYLSAVYRAVRAAGGLCIADEVQTGLGRMGTHCWAFEAHDVVPDIVVMGKPLGNGHPIGAVVTTRAIADSFDTGMEFFSTFGGNNVSCAIGLAVLDVLRDEQLQSHALRVGARMHAGLDALRDRHAIIGDVRGTGLFLGVELVRDPETLEPAGPEASFVANRMREMGVLLGTDGPHHNVVKIRPPMPFDEANADLLVDVFESALRKLRGSTGV